MSRYIDTIDNTIMRRPLIPLFISYLAGLLVGNYLHLPTKLALALAVFLLFIFSVAILFDKKPFVMVLFPLVFITLGGLFINLHIHPRLPHNHISNLVKNDPLNVQGTLYKPPELMGDKHRLYLKAEKVYLKRSHVKVSGKLLLTIGESETDLKYGDRIRFVCRLHHPRNFRNPGGFDYVRYLAVRGIFVTGYLKSNMDIARLGEGDSNPFRKRIEGFRDRIRDLIDGKPQLQNKGIIKALLLGEKREISEEARDNFTAAGVAHVLAISGLHLGFVAMAAFFFIKGTLGFSERLTLALNINKVAAILTLFPVLFYAFIAGFGISTFRATIMIVTFLTAIIIDRERDLHNTLALAGFIITVISPAAVFDVSFQLSFVSVWAILYLTPRLLDYSSLIPDLPCQRVPPVIRKVARHTGLLVLVSLAATLGTGPITAYHFNRITLMGFMSNVVIVPLVGFIIVPLSLLVALTVFISPPLASLLLDLDAAIVGFLVDMAAFFSNIPGVSFWVTTPTLLEMTLFYLLFAFLSNLKKSKMAGPFAVILLIFIAGNYTYWYCSKNFNNDLRVTFLDVGQGDSAVVEFPQGKRMLIDGGGFYNNSFDTGKNIIAPFLWRKKINRIDYILLSHPHPDHLNGLRFIAENFAVKEVWTNGKDTNLKPFREFMAIIRDNEIRQIRMTLLTPPRDINRVKVAILNPPAPPFQRQEKDFRSSLNNNSLVVKLTFKDVSFLFTGDIEFEAERRLMQAGERLESTVIKAPHHGSSTSSTKGFLAQVRPSYAVFSVGNKNRFGFPKNEIVERYRDMDCGIFRTDRDGAITMVTDGETLSIKTFGPKLPESALISGQTP